MDANDKITVEIDDEVLIEQITKLTTTLMPLLAARGKHLPTDDLDLILIKILFHGYFHTDRDRRSKIWLTAFNNMQDAIDSQLEFIPLGQLSLLGTRMVAAACRSDEASKARIAKVEHAIFNNYRVLKKTI